MADQILGFTLIRRDQVRLGANTLSQRLAFRVENQVRPRLTETLDGIGVPILGDIARKRAREHHGVGVARHVLETVEQRVELLHRDARAVLDDLCLTTAGRVDQDGRTARLACDRDKIAEDAFACEFAQDARPGFATDQARCDHGLLENVKRTGDVDALASRRDQALSAAVTHAELHARHLDRLIECGVGCDGDNHAGWERSGFALAESDLGVDSEGHWVEIGIELDDVVGGDSVALGDCRERVALANAVEGWH